MAKKQLPEDFKEFIECLNSNNVRYLLVGGWAIGMHGYPRATKDIDFLVSVKHDNLEKLEKTLIAFGGPPVKIELLKKKGYAIRMGNSPIQIDIISEADGIDFDDCYKRKKIIKTEKVKINVISKNDLIKNKRASGRTMDIADAERLENIK